MEANRLRLHDLLEQLMEEAGEPKNLYFQPPASVLLQYPCVIYHLSRMPSHYADDTPYLLLITFDVTYITRSPTSSIPDLLQSTPGFAFDRYYTADNLHHYAFTYNETKRR